MIKKFLSLSLFVVMVGLAVWALGPRSASGPIPAKPYLAPALALSGEGAEGETRVELPSGPAEPLPPDLPTVLLIDQPIAPSPLAGVMDLPYVPPSPETRPEFEIVPAPKAADSRAGQAAPAEPALILGAMPTPTLSFNALTFSLNGAGHPPDTNGDVGPNHYMLSVNTSIGIYTKTTGALATAFTINSFWSGAATGTPCDTTNQGDPIVLYDDVNGHWIFMDFAWTNLMSGPYYFCFGVSQTSNPLGSYWRYAIRADDAVHPWLPDYPKGGVWPDGLYFSANMFDCPNSTCSSASYKEARVYALNLQKMESGAVLTANDAQAKDTSGSYFTLMPSNARGSTPPVGTPNYFVGESTTVYAWNVFKFHVDFTTPANSTFTGPTNVSQASYTTAANTVPQPAPGNAADTLADRVMFLNQYRNLNGTESLWVQHTTGTASASTPTGIQWAQINVTGGTINTTPVQQQIFNNGADGVNRFMGSMAVDQQGNAALGYSVSSSSVAPDIRYVGRLAGDPLNQLPQSETTLLSGVTRSVQTGYTRWGDYSSMSVDPVDDCTFWYANMYFPVQGGNWVTRIGAFKFPSCGAAPTLTDTLTSLSSSPNPSVFGQAVTFTATVVISGGAGTPTGTVTFFDNGASLGSGSLNGSGQAMLATSSLAVGAYTAITATYSGNANFNGSTSSVHTHTVNKANTTTSVTSAPNPSVFGQAVTFTATVAIDGAGAGTPTGTVTFFDNGASLGSGGLNGSGQAMLATSSLAVGAHTAITATYSGNANFNGSTLIAYTHTVNKVNTATSLTSAPNPSMFGQTVTFTATVVISGTGTGTPTGTVTFFDNGVLIGSGSVNASGQATLATSALAVGMHSPITVTYGGNANFTSSLGMLSGGQVVIDRRYIYLPLITR
ncbi:hypothetical protein TFLX_06723 [Thermoflexales bacterium]|nr:hypothetical protein TFLX_06723 [Thermoflexales bacterium]